MEAGYIYTYIDIITKHPHMVEIYEKMDIRDEFLPIEIACAVDNYAITKTESTYGKISVVVTYHTNYIGENGKQSLLPIGIGNGVSVNTLIGLPTFFSWKIVLDVTK